MRPDDFRASEIGRVKKGLGRFGFWYFEPAPIPRELDLSTETVMALSAADTALADSQGLDGFSGTHTGLCVLM
jgi:hypothetical protein